VRGRAFLVASAFVASAGPFSAPAAPAIPAPPALLAPPASPALFQQRPSNRLFPPQDLSLLEAPDREDWQKPELIMDELQIADGSRVADLGAGGGWFTIRLARRVGPNGLVYAQDIQPLMIEAMSRRVEREGLKNVVPVLGTATDPKLPQAGELDAVLIVGAIHEMDDPARPEVILTLLDHVARALRPQGRLGIVDFTPGGGGPGPAADERVDPDAVIATAARAGFRLQKREAIPPFIFLLVFGKDGRAPGAR
jgi:ubiquinone/menaquinone biosynthesis C-methylase UbiE